MSDLHRDYLEIACLSMLLSKSMSTRDLMLEMNQQGSNISEVSIKSATTRLMQLKLIRSDPDLPSNYLITSDGQLVFGNLLNFLLNHINSLAWDNMTPIRDSVISGGDIAPGETVLDCSSGIGDWFAKELSREVGPKGQVIFLSQDARYNLEYYEKLILQQPEYSNISYVLKEEFVGKIESNSIDAVFQIFGIHLYENVSVIMQDLCRIIKPGGKIVICDPVEIDHYIFNQFQRKYPKLHTGTIPENLRTILLQAGFKNINMNSLDGLCIASAEKVARMPGQIPLEPLKKPEDKEREEKEKHYYKL